MSNKYLTFLGIILLPSLTLGSWAQSDTGALLAAGDRQFDYGLYEQALPSYEAAFQQGVEAPTLLYRLAYIYERLGRYPECIFYLRKLEWQSGDPAFTYKIQQLIREQATGWAISAQAWPGYRLWMQRNQGYLLLVMGVLLLLGAAGVLGQPLGPWGQAGLMTLSGATLIGGVMLLHNYLPAQKGVLTAPTYFYEGPGYFYDYQRLPIPPGTTLSIRDQSDIWLLVEAGGYRYWAPRQAIREL